MILATAAFHVRLYIPFAIPALRLFRPRFVKSYVKSKMLTHDPIEAARYDSDPLISRQIAVNLLVDVHDMAQRLLADAGAIHTPVLMIGAGRDWVVSLNAQRKFFDGVSSSAKRMCVFRDAYHAVFHEMNRGEVVKQVREFVRERFAQTQLVPSLLEADRSGHTSREYERLKSNGSLKFAIARVGLKTAGRLSRGIELGWRTGFDSGVSLDYIYQN